MSGRSGLRGDGEVHRSLSRERSLTRVGVRARSGSRERMEDRTRRSEERLRRADTSGSRNCIRRPSPSPTGEICEDNIFMVKVKKLRQRLCFSILIWSLVFLWQGHGCLGLTLRPTFKTDSDAKKSPIWRSKTLHLFSLKFLSFLLLFCCFGFYCLLFYKHCPVCEQEYGLLW